MDRMMLVWLVVLVVSIITEIISLGLTSIWFAGGALAAVVLAAFRLPLQVQVLVFLVISILLMVFARPIAVKYFNKDRVRTNVESMIGRQAIVVCEIDNLQGVGEVTVGGQEWMARTEKDGQVLAVGDVVQVVAVQGVKLIVREDPQMKAVHG